MVLLALFADNSLSESEAKFIQPFLNSVAGLFAKCREDYKPYGSLSSSTSLNFLCKYRDDREPFGFECSNTSWSGLALCRRLAEVGGDTNAFENHCNTLRSLAKAILQLDEVSECGRTFLDRLEATTFKVSEGSLGTATYGRDTAKDSDLISRDFTDLRLRVGVEEAIERWLKKQNDSIRFEWRKSAESGDARGQTLCGIYDIPRVLQPGRGHSGRQRRSDVSMASQGSKTRHS